MTGSGPPTADFHWDGQWRRASAARSMLGGTLLPPLRDHHVHLGLVDLDELSGSALSAVDDLGWSLSAARAWKAGGIGGRTVRAVGRFVTAPGGYPAGRVWAPEDAVRQVGSAADAAAAVRETAEAGLDACKIALHSGMPLLGDAELTAAVREAHACGLPVIAHVEGEGQARRAFEAGVDVLAHTPWTEALDPHLIADMASMQWISTLNIHAAQSAPRSIAIDNAAAFRQAGGTLLYGTDMGNGPTPAGLNPAELTALSEVGMDIHQIIAAAAVTGDSSLVTWSPEPPPRTIEEFIQWCQSLTTLSIDDSGDLHDFQLP